MKLTPFNFFLSNVLILLGATLFVDWVGRFPLSVFWASCCQFSTLNNQNPDDVIPVQPDLWPELVSAIPLDSVEEAHITKLLKQMTLEEKVGQMVQGEIQSVTPQDVREYHLGSILNGGGSYPDNKKHSHLDDWLSLADEYYDASMDPNGTPIPILWGTDAVHGHSNVYGGTLFPHNIGLGAANNPTLMSKIGWATAREVISTGMDWNFSPTVAVAQDVRWGRTYESFSENPDIVAKLSASYLEGLQGQISSEQYLKSGKVLATAKHFIGDGGTQTGKDQGNTILSEKKLVEIHSPGYVELLNRGVQTVMVSFSSWNSEKIHGRQDLLTDVLKKRMGFNGFVVSDWDGHAQVPNCSRSRCPQSINAGVDMMMVPRDWKAFYTNTLKDVKTGVIPETRINDAVRRILRVKIRAGLFEAGRPSERPLAKNRNLLGAAAHRAIARQAVRESLVLLKNKNQLLPISSEATVLVTGEGANNIAMQSGGWSMTWQGTENENQDFLGATSLYQGLANTLIADGGKAIFSKDGTYQEKPDVAIVIFGEPPYAEGQGDLDSQDHIDFTSDNDDGLKKLRYLKSKGIPVVGVFLSGRPLWINPELNASDAFVAAFLPGTEGQGLADVLVGTKDGTPRYDFSGQLSFPWPKKLEQIPLNQGDGQIPLFPIGYGLSYVSSTIVPENLNEDLESRRSSTKNNDIPIFSRRISPSWLYSLKDAVGETEITGSRVKTSGSNPLSLKASDRYIQEDALRLEWSGMAASLNFMPKKSLDLSALSPQSVFAFDARIVESKNAPINLSVNCGEDCIKPIDLVPTLSTAPAQWFHVEVPLSCLGDNAIHPLSEKSTLLFESESEQVLELYNLRLLSQSTLPGDGCLQSEKVLD